MHLLVHWQPYALLMAGIGGMVIGQSAFQAGSLDASLPTMSVVDPIVSIVIGALAFGESIAAGPGDVAAGGDRPDGHVGRGGDAGPLAPAARAPQRVQPALQVGLPPRRRPRLYAAAP